MSDAIKLPNGSQLVLQTTYTTREANGVIALVIVSSISSIAAIGLLVTIFISTFTTRTSPDQHVFVRTPVAVYFVSLILCDLLQAIGSILNAKWVWEKGIRVGDMCVLQGVVKQTSDVGAAFWTLVIAIHTFSLLFLRLRLRRSILWATLIAGWSGIAAIVIAGPATLDTAKNGPFFSISGYWCWISPEYPTERITLDYLLMFMTAFFSLLIYTLIFFRLRGNLVVHDWHIRFRTLSKDGIDTRKGGEAAIASPVAAVAKQMLLYPLAYTVLILPIAASRFSSWSGHDVPFEVMIFSEVVFLSAGLVNVILFTTTRRILPPSFRRSPTARSLQHTFVFEPGTHPSYPKSVAYQETFGDQRTLTRSVTTSDDRSFYQSDVSDLLIPVERSVPPLKPRSSHFPRPLQRSPSALPPIRINSGESFYSLYNYGHHQVESPLTSRWSPSEFPVAHAGRRR